MKVGSSRVFFGAVAIGVMCLLAAASGQAVHAQSAPERAPLTEEVFKSVALLRGIPVDTFFEAMGMFANAMGNDCTYCHVKEAYFNRAQFATPTPRIMRARQMIVMMNAINKQYFGGQPRVTCFTCHGGDSSPKLDPDIALQYSEPVEDPNARNFPPDVRFTADQVFDKYLRALGGAGALSKLASYTAKGTYEGFDTSFDKIPVEIFGKAPNQLSMIVRMTAGESIRTFDGRNGWWTGPDTPLPLVTLTGGNLDRARLEAMVPFPTGFKQAFPEWRVARTAIDGNEVQVVQGLNGGQVLAQFYFDEAGMLVRLVRWTPTPVGLVPTQIDYSDYRDVAGVKLPFTWTVSQTYMQMKIVLSSIEPNVPVDPARFAKPAASAVARPIG